MCHWTEYEQSSLHVTISEENAATQKLMTAKIWGCASGPSPAFSSRGGKKQKEGPKTRRGATFLKFCIGCMQQPGGQTWNERTQISNEGNGNTVPPAGDDIAARVKTGEWNTLTTALEQFTTAKWDFANVLPNTSSRAQKVCGCTGWRIPLLARSNLAKYTNWECASSTQVNFQCFVMHRTSANFSFPFSLLRLCQSLNASMLRS